MAKRQSLTDYIRDSVILFLGVLLAAYLTPSITYDETSTLIIVALILALLNLFLKPLLILFAFPFVVLTLGLGIWLINALLLAMTGGLVPGFSVPSFGSALVGSLVISLTNLLVSLIFGAPRVHIRRNVQRGPRGKAPRRRQSKDDDVIDV